MEAADKKVQDISEEVSVELEIDPEELMIGVQDNPSQSVVVLMERMDKICAIMSYQNELIERSKKELENAKYRYKRAEKDYKHKLNESYLKYKQEDREKYGTDFKKLGRTDPEYHAMAELDADVKLNEALTAERDHLTALHNLQNKQHSYECLNNHFLSYRKSCDLLKMELDVFPRKYDGA
jgi:hypothetical protein